MVVMVAARDDAMPPASVSFEELLAVVLSDDRPWVECLHAHRDAIRAGYASATVIDRNPGCMRGDEPLAWRFEVFFVHLLRTDGLGDRRRRHDHTPTTVTVGSLEDGGHGAAMGRGPA